MERKGYIGGSDLYSIMRGDLHDLWKIKTGRAIPDDLGNMFNVQLGVMTEKFNMDWLQRDTGYHVEKLDPLNTHTKVISDVPYQARPDGIAYDDEGVAMIVECKHTSSFKKMSDILEMYLPQVHLYMRVTELKHAVFSVIFGNRWEHCVVDYNHEFWMKVSTEAHAFWQYVVEDKEPPLLEPAKIDWSDVKIDGLISRDASQDNQFVNLAHDFVNTSQHLKQHDVVKKELRSMINDNEREVFCDLLSIKRDKRGACRIYVNEGAE
jgi:hypothetical protein